MTSVRKKFLSIEQLEKAVDEVTRVFEQFHGSLPVLIGGFALQLYGSDRLTTDVDFIAEEESYEGEFELRGYLAFGGVGVVTSEGVPVDLVVREDEYAALYLAAAEDAIEVDGISAPVARLEYLAAMKMAAGRGKDMLDLEFIAGSDELNRAETREIIDKYLGLYAAKAFDRILEEVDREKSRGER